MRAQETIGFVDFVVQEDYVHFGNLSGVIRRRLLSVVAWLVVVAVVQDRPSDLPLDSCYS